MEVLKTGEGWAESHPPAEQSSVEVESVEITPEVASEYLTHNTHNRHVRQTKVDAYARDMANGNWRWNGVPIAFDTEGTLIEGQHRLMAVVKSEATIPMLVIRGLPRQTQETYDRGIGRTVGDALMLRGKGYENYVGSTARRVWQWLESKPGWTFTGQRLSVTLAELMELIEGDETIFQAGRWAGSHSKQIHAIPSITGLAYWAFHQIDSEAADQFFDDLLHPEGLDADDPVMTLRMRFLNDAAKFGRTNHSWANEEDQMALYCYAWNARREGRTLARMAIRRDLPFPTPR